MSDIFYSQVDSNVWLELNERGRAGFSRDTKDLRFMLEKIANVAIIPYNLGTVPGSSFELPPDFKTPISEAVLGGTTVRSGEYLPSGINGYLTDRSYTVTTYGFNEAGQQVVKDQDPRTNTSKRIPPFITSMDMSIGDHSMGLLNSVTMNITVPNPERDLNYIESVYLRPGRHVTVVIEHPESAVLTMSASAGRLSDETLPSLKRIAELQEVTEESLRKNLQRFRKLNSVCFDGLIQSFSLDYQTDTSVTVTLNIIGTSNVYTDVSLLINSSEIDKDNKQTTTENKAFESFFDGLNKQIQKYSPNKINAEKTVFKYTNGTETHYGVEGKPSPGFASQTYIQLTWLIDYINTAVISKIQKTIPYSKIIFSENNDLSVSNYYNNMCSTDPMNIFFSDTTHRKYQGTEDMVSVPRVDDNGLPVTGSDGRQIIDEMPGTFKGWFIYTTGSNNDTVIDRLEFDVANIPGRPNIQSKQPKSFHGSIILDTNNPTNTKNIARPTSIFINTSTIQTIVKDLETNQTLTVNALLDSVSTIIYNASGYAINLKLITHPEEPTSLLWCDCNYTPDINSVKPYPVPMFANHPYGTIVRDFKFSGQLPQDATNLAYVLNSDPSEISESNIAPFVSFMYTANSVTRSGPNESIQSIISDEDFQKIKQKYAEAHTKYFQLYLKSRAQLAQNYTSIEYQSAMRNALQKYVQYPASDILLSNEIAAPTIPFSVEFTTDGINGFRYGDVLTFDGLPDRYKRNAVFCVISVTHTVGNDGVWTTTVRCIMRPKIG